MRKERTLDNWKPVPIHVSVRAASLRPKVFVDYLKGWQIRVLHNHRTIRLLGPSSGLAQWGPFYLLVACLPPLY